MSPLPYSRADHPWVAPLAAAAFSDDPGFAWMFPDPAERPAQLAWLETYLARTRPDPCICEHLDRRVIAVWVPPGRSAVPALSAELRAGLLTAPLRVGWASTWRALAANRAANSRMNRARSPAWYLDTLAVAPDAQGAGLGGAMLRHGLARAAGAPVVLFTVKLSNVMFYRKFGFEVTEESPLVEGGPTAWTMCHDGSRG